MTEKTTVHAQELARLVPEIMRTFRQMMFVPSDVQDLTISQAMLLARLARHGPCNASAIGEMMDITSGSVTALTDRLIKRGLICREQDEQDRRVAIFSLTVEAQQFVQAMHERRLARLQEICTHLGEERSDTLIALFREVRDLLQTMG